MALAAILLVTVSTAGDAYNYALAKAERNLASTMTWASLPTSGTPTSASCYNSEYSYYKSWVCEVGTSDLNCKEATAELKEGQSFCEKQTDP